MSNRMFVTVGPNRGTGLGVLLALLVIAKSDPDADVICLPSNHLVEDEDLLAKSPCLAAEPWGCPCIPWEPVFDASHRTLDARPTHSPIEAARPRTGSCHFD